VAGKTTHQSMDTTGGGAGKKCKSHPKTNWMIGKGNSDYMEKEEEEEGKDKPKLKNQQRYIKHI